MSLTRREMLAACAATVPALAAADAKSRSRLGVVIHSYGQRSSAGRERGEKVPFQEPRSFLDHVEKLGGAGVQVGLGIRDSAYSKALRARADATGMYVEGIINLPRDEVDVARFDAEVRSARACGAVVLRCVALSSRRYETFDTPQAFEQFAKRAWAMLTLAEPVVAKHDVRLAIENHKDWRAEELVDLLKRLSSRHVGVCVDTGNSIALLEDPMRVVEAYAPWAFTTHFKDMGAAEYSEGFLLAEVPFGDGFLDLAQIVRVLHAARPEVKLNIEMITRDPLKVPCLTAKYWTTFEKLPGRHLAEALARVRRHAAKQPLPVVSTLPREKRVAIEEENVKRCLAYGREKLELTG